MSKRRGFNVRPTTLELDKGRAVTLAPSPDGFPDEVTICGQRWTVVYSPDLSEYGLTWPRRHVIAIATDQDPEAMTDTLLHECLHALESMLPPKQRLEEKQVHAITPLLLSLLRSNDPWW